MFSLLKVKISVIYKRNIVKIFYCMTLIVLKNYRNNLVIQKILKILFYGHSVIQLMEILTPDQNFIKS